MSLIQTRLLRSGALLAINALFVMVWGFAGLGKLANGMPPWFGDKFGKTFLASFPGLTAAFWILALSELLAFGLVAGALARGEFLERRAPLFFASGLIWSLVVWVQLSFGQWLTSEFNATHQLFMYFCGTLVCLCFVAPRLLSSPSNPGSTLR